MKPVYNRAVIDGHICALIDLFQCLFRTVCLVMLVEASEKIPFIVEMWNQIPRFNILEQQNDFLYEK